MVTFSEWVFVSPHCLAVVTELRTPATAEARKPARLFGRHFAAQIGSKAFFECPPVPVKQGLPPHWAYATHSSENLYPGHGLSPATKEPLKSSLRRQQKTGWPNNPLPTTAKATGDAA